MNPSVMGLRAPALHAVGTQHVMKAALVFAMLAITLLDRFGIRLTADFSIPPGLIALYGLVGAMMISGAAQLSGRGALAYCAVAGVTGLSLLANAAFAPQALVSVPSFLLLLVLYAPLAIQLRREAGSSALWRWTADLYVALAVVVALAGIAQFFVQFVFRPSWLFDYGPLIPGPLRGSGGWNTVYSTGEWTKSNGFFLREPSVFSVLMAFALLCELNLARRKWVMALLGLALVLTYSGSGLLCLAAGMLFPLGRSTWRRVLACAAVAAAGFFLFAEALNLSYTLARVDEFGAAGSSAHCRFVYPGIVALREIDSSPWTALLGHGPGTMERMGATCADGHQTTYAKALFEYGLAGVLAFAVLIVRALNQSGSPIGLRVAAGVAWVLLGGNLLASEVLLFIYVLSALWPQGVAASPVKARDIANPRPARAT